MTTRATHEATCLIMAALARDSQHGRAIIARVVDLSGGRVRLRAGMLFTALDGLRAAGLVSIDRDEFSGGRRRRYYRLATASSVKPERIARRVTHPDVRISDAERDGAAAALGEHFAQGRLTAVELHARLHLALAAVTWRDIWLAGRDLPWQLAWPEGGGGDGAADHPARQDAEAP
jgi:DNA-binding PadR family transcriptional regulator